MFHSRLPDILVLKEKLLSWRVTAIFTNKCVSGTRTIAGCYILFSTICEWNKNKAPSLLSILAAMNSTLSGSFQFEVFSLFRTLFFTFYFASSWPMFLPAIYFLLDYREFLLWYDGNKLSSYKSCLLSLLFHYDSFIIKIHRWVKKTIWTNVKFVFYFEIIL